MEIYKIAEIIESRGHVKIFRLVPAGGKNVDFRPGQFIMLHLLDANGESLDKRPYSIASAPDSSYIELAIKMINGSFTSKLNGVKAGEAVGIDGPFGHFVFDNEKKAIFIAGGVGIAPIMAMLRYIYNKRMAGDYLLLYSCKTKKDVLYEEELKKLKEMIKTVIFLTRENKAYEGYETGRMDAAKIKKYLPDMTGYACFMCGSLEMIKSMRDALIKIGVPESSIKHEGWG